MHDSRVVICIVWVKRYISREFKSVAIAEPSVKWLARVSVHVVDRGFVVGYALGEVRAEL
jgi:hypothetical protein